MTAKKSTANPPASQLSFLDQSNNVPQSKEPVPVLAGRQFGFDLPYIDARDSKTYFRLRSWIAGCIGEETAKKTIQNLRNRGYFSKAPPSDANRSHLMIIEDIAGQAVEFEYVTDELLYRITQDLRSTKNRPVVDAIKNYLAAAGVLVDQYRLDPSKAVEAGIGGMLAQGMDERKAKARVKGIVARVDFGMVAKVTHEANKPNYAALTTAEYLNLFGRGKAAIVAELGLTDSEAKQFRDHLDTLALQALEAAETTAARRMEKLGRLLNDEEQIEIVIFAARLAAPAFKAMAEYAGNDLATGKPLLPAKSRR